MNPKKIGQFIIILIVTVSGYYFYTQVQGANIKTPDRTGLTGYWPLDEGYGGRYSYVKDASGNGRDMQITHGPAGAPPTWIDGKLGKALSFNTVSPSYLGQTTASNQFITTSEGTISVWIRPAATGVAGVVYDLPAVISDNAGYFGIHQGIYDGVDLIWAYNYDGVEDAVGVTYTPGEWIHITWVHSGGTLYLYKNGELMDSTPSGNTGVLAAALSIGKNYSGAYFNGDIDEVRVYNTALSADEIKKLYESGITNVGKSNTRTLNDSLVGHWTFDGPDMVTNVADVSGSGNDGTLDNFSATTTVPGVIGQALTFDGVSSPYDRVIIPNTSGALQPGIGDFSASFWYKGFSQGGFILDQTTADGFFQIGNNGSGGRYYMAAAGFIGYAYGNFALPNDTNWHHVVFTLDRSTNPDTITFYVDGENTPLISPQNAFNDHAIITTTLTIGSSGTFVSSAARNDPMDDVRIYNRLLSPTEVKQLYNMGAGNKQAVTHRKTDNTGLVAHYTFDGGDTNWDTNTITDKSGNGYTGTITSMATSTAQAIGVIGQAFQFDGTNDYVNLGSGIQMGTGDMSVSLWYKGLKGSTENFIGSGTSFGNTWDVRNSGASFITGGASVTNSYTLPSDSDWHHIVIVLDRRGGSYDGVSFYLDGVFQDMETGNLNGETINTGGNTVIGAGTWLGGGYRQGATDDIRIYNKALSQNEVSELYHMGR